MRKRGIGIPLCALFFALCSFASARSRQKFHESDLCREEFFLPRLILTQMQRLFGKDARSGVLRGKT